MAEFARWDDGAIRQGVNLWINALNQGLERFIIQVGTIGHNEPLKGISQEEVEHKGFIIPPLGLACSKVFKSRARTDNLL